MTWRPISPFMMAGFVLAVTLAVGLFAFEDFKVFFDAPNRVLLSMTSILFSLVVCDQLLTKSSLESAPGSITTPPDQVPTPGGLRAKLGILFAGHLTCWFIALLYVGWLYKGLTTGTLSTLATATLLGVAYALAGFSVFLTFRTVSTVVAK